MNIYTFEVTLIIIIALLSLVFAGEPDLQDALIHLLMETP